MKKLLFVTLSVFMAMVWIAPQNAVAEKPIKIGVLVPLSGIVAQGGLEMKEGIEMAAKEKGKLLGRPIELVVEDTRIKPDVAVSKAEKLVFKDGCVALIGVFSSGVGLAIAKNIDRLNVPFLTTHVMTTKFYGLNKFVFRSGQLTERVADEVVAPGVTTPRKDSSSSPRKTVSRSTMKTMTRRPPKPPTGLPISARSRLRGPTVCTLP